MMDRAAQSDGDIDGYFSTARVSGREGAVALPEGDYVDFLYDHDDPVLADGRGMTWQEFTEDRYQAPFLQDLLAYWRSLYDEPFVGVTSDGRIEDGLYRLPPGGSNDPGMVDAADRLLALLTQDEAERVRYPIDAPEWRSWSNPEFVVHRTGLRLEELSDEKAQAALAVVRASLSPQGYERVAAAMSLNGFLGEITDLPAVMNERSYWFSLYGTPSVDEPWGWQLFGHHVALNVVAVGGRLVIAPVFLGAEPALSDDEHPPIFAEREELALRLAASLTDDQRRRAVVYESVLDPAMPEGRLHPADERHVAGAFRDNRVIPCEGLQADVLDETQRDLLLAVVEDFLLLLPDDQRAATLVTVGQHLDDTWIAWYGATDGTQPFYFRIQSPVILVELDHHAGVWLSNRLPARFHVHTTLRHPNGNDYGRAYLTEWRSRSA